MRLKTMDFNSQMSWIPRRCRLNIEQETQKSIWSKLNLLKLLNHVIIVRSWIIRRFGVKLARWVFANALINAQINNPSICSGVPTVLSYILNMTHIFAKWSNHCSTRRLWDLPTQRRAHNWNFNFILKVIKAFTTNLRGIQEIESLMVQFIRGRIVIILRLLWVFLIFQTFWIKLWTWHLRHSIWE